MTFHRHPLMPFGQRPRLRSEEHTSELQSQSNLVCRLLLEKKKNSSFSLRPQFSMPRSSSLRTPTRTLLCFLVASLLLSNTHSQRSLYSSSHHVPLYLPAPH